MNFNQKVLIRNLDYFEAAFSFLNINFVKYLISWQPVKLIKWDGIATNDKAHFKFWFFKWHDFKVKHKFKTFSNKEMIFEDLGTQLPLGLEEWRHKHVITKKNNCVIITDKINFKHKNFLLEIILYPILTLPIITRRILYNRYFNLAKTQF